MPFDPQTTCDVAIDVSHHQNDIDWARVKNAGKQLVIIKASQGMSKDSRWDANRQGALQHGLLIIPYAFLTADDDPLQQADFFIQTAGLVAGMPAALDWEGDSAPEAQDVETIGKRVAQTIHRDPLAYWGLTPPDPPTDAMKQWPRWIPRYGVNDGHPDPNHKPTEPWLFWQYTSKGKVNGIAGDVDASLFAGSEDELREWCRSGALPGALV